MTGFRSIRGFVGVLALAACGSAADLSAQTRDDLGVWFAALGNGKFCSDSENPSPVRWWFDAHQRLLEDADGFNQSILRPGVGVEIAENQVLWAGYAWIRTSPISGDDFDEHRVWQQWTAAPTLGEFRFLHRSRLEERWFDDSGDVALRWRQMFRVQRPFTTSPEWSLVAWNEAFFNLNDTDRGIAAGFDQNRAFFGFGYRHDVESPVRTEVGYLNQFINTSSGDDLMNHILSINFFF